MKNTCYKALPRWNIGRVENCRMEALVVLIEKIYVFLGVLIGGCRLCKASG